MKQPLPCGVQVFDFVGGRGIGCPPRRWKECSMADHVVIRGLEKGTAAEAGKSSPSKALLNSQGYHTTKKVENTFRRGKIV